VDVDVDRCCRSYAASALVHPDYACERTDLKLVAEVDAHKRGYKRCLVRTSTTETTRRQDNSSGGHKWLRKAVVSSTGMKRLVFALSALALHSASSSSAQADNPAADAKDSSPAALPSDATAAAKPAVNEVTPAAAGTTASNNQQTLPVVAQIEHFTWALAGVLRVQSGVVQNDPNVQFIGRADGFEVQTARLGLSGHYRERIAVELSMDGAIDERERPNDPNGRLRVGLRDAYTDIAFGDSLHGISFRAGRFAIMMDPDLMITITERAFVARSVLSRGVRATEGWETEGLPPGRSNGAAVRLDSGACASRACLGFELAVQNGAGEFASANDNDSYAVSLAGFVRLPNHGFVVATGRWNPRTIGDLPLRKDQTDLEGAASGLYRAGPVEVVAGFMLRHTRFDTTGGPAQISYGGQAQLMYTLPIELPLAVGYRFGLLDPSNLVLTDRVMEHTVGATVGLPRLRSRIQLNIAHVAEQAERKLANDRVEALLEVAL
jgi:hypothetical protein